ncbi:MAG: zinc ribbon domain-containing protein [Candidatus Gracilibacteria bacterium]|nr:zinc ribbon domain-containing protein [Candidatus Gracilibacteria bacterium]
MNAILNYDYLGLLSELFGNISFEMFLKLIIVYFFILWIAIIVWVTKDIINRTTNIFMQIVCILIVLFGTPFGVIIYLLVRPSQTLFEKYYEEDIVNEELDDVLNLPEVNENEEKISCFSCDYIISKDYKFCPNCRTKLKHECIGCSKELKLDWSICPFCGKDQETKINNILEKKEEKVELEVKNKEN